MRVLFLLMLFLAALMPAIPDPTDLRAIAFGAVSGLLMCVWLVRCLMRNRWPSSTTGGWLAVFLALVGLSVLAAQWFGTSLDLWLRGAIPFLFLSLFFPAYELARNDPRWVVKAVGVSAVAWLGNVAFVAGAAVPSVLRGEVLRITHATEAWASFQLPYAMIGLVISLFSPPRRVRWLRWPLAVAFSVVPLLAVSRGQIIVVGLVWAFYVVGLARGRRWGGTFANIAGLVLVGSLVASRSELGYSILERFAATGLQSEGSRLEEISYALQQFRESPLIGKGLGYQIPAEITFAADWTVIAEAGVGSVGYTHNLVGYLLMDLGLAGFLAYSGFIVSAFRGGRKTGIPDDHEVWRAGVLMISALLCWFLIQASFRLIQSNVLLAVAVAVLSAIRERGKPMTYARSA
jgi:hypothetical protein